MSQDLNLFINQVIQDMWVRADSTKVEEYYAPEYIGHEAGKPYDREALKQYVKEYAARYKNPSCHVEDTIIGEEKVSLRFVHKAIDTKTNQPVMSHGISIWHLKDNKITAGWIATEPPLE